MKLKTGDRVETPRFGQVIISVIFDDNDNAMINGYTEPTHYRDEECHIRGKSIGENRMIFAAIKRK